MSVVFEFENMLFISSILKWYSPIITVIAMIISFVMAFKLRNKNGSINKIAVCIGGILIGISIALIVILQLGIFNLETVEGYKDNVTYFGQVKNGKAYGNGRLFDENGNLIYQGEFKNSSYDGKGKQYLIENEQGKEVSVLCYEGDFEKGKYSGKGKFYFTSGERKGELVYEGDFYESNYNGQGTLYYSKDHTYKGGFAESKKHGFGKEIYTSSEGKEVVIYGTYSNDKLNGHGRRYEDGTLIYDGQFADGLFSGEGILYYDNGNIQYKGMFANGNAEGEGIKYSEENNGEEVVTGIWKENKLVEKE